MTNNETPPAQPAPKTFADQAARLVRRAVRRVRVTLEYGRRLLLKKIPLDEAMSVRARVEEEGKFTERYALMCALSAAIATLGLLQGSAAVVIGAMLVSPLMSPIATLGFSIASLNARRTQEAARVVAIGAAIGVGVGMAITWLSPIRDATPEILARTEPTLLDLAVAVLSGLAGGYATVHHRGETAIGVAIATALMPPLATLGYAIAVWRIDFAMGAGLLFLANLAAIAFSFGLVARLRGAAWAFAPKEVRTRYAIVGVLVFLILATPLALTLRRVTREAIASQTARSAIMAVMEADSAQIAQLSVRWENLGDPEIEATVVTPNFVVNGETLVRERIESRLRAPAAVELRQVVAADTRAEAIALINSALERTPRRAAAPGAPVDAVRDAARLAVTTAWADESTRTIHVLAAPEGRPLDAYRAEETRLNALGFGWAVAVTPPYVMRAPILFGDDEVALGPEEDAQVEVALWALRRWGVQEVIVEGLSGRATGRSQISRILADGRAGAVAAALRRGGVSAEARRATPETAARLAGDGEARVRAADILPFEARAAE
ncbi:MAG: DUF389 domain-containing protein [Alphaproteobacteria bacterium]|nr:DUF389 domain-containing protein [Alphaproteobacteria bacterium]